MKRFVTYIYIYDKCEKQKNIGFIKVDVNDDIFKLDVRIQNVGKLTGRCPIFIMIGKNNLTGIKIGELDIRRGCANGQYILEKNNIKETGYGIDDVVGVRVDVSDDILLASCWTDDVAYTITGQYTVWQKPVEKTDMNSTQQNITISKQKSEEKIQSDNQLNEEKEIQPNRRIIASYENQQEKSSRLKKIDLADIKNLPKKNWYLCNNSFLLHGFFSYHYLVIKEMEENGVKKCYLGVPGVYERPEKAMALLFGFPEFEAENSNQPEPIGEFGYWYCLLDM